MDGAITAIVTVATAIVGVAALAVLVSKNADTSNVVQSFGGAFSQGLGAAVSPITNYSVGLSSGVGYGNFNTMH